MRRFSLVAAVAVAFPALADEPVITYKVLMADGFNVVGTQFFETDFVALLTRGQDSFLCTLALVKEDQGYSSGPWNEYRPCKRLSGGADYVFNAATGELEPVK